MNNNTLRNLMILCLYVALIGIFVYPIVEDGTIGTNVAVAITMLGGFFFSLLNDILRELIKLNSRFDEVSKEAEETEV